MQPSRYIHDWLTQATKNSTAALQKNVIGELHRIKDNSGRKEGISDLHDPQGHAVLSWNQNYKKSIYQF